MAEGRCRGWCWTLNNYVDSELLKLKDWKNGYIVFGFETGAQGTDHLQGFCKYKNPVTMKRIKEDISTRCHVERQMGTDKQAIDYCKKDGVWLAYGDEPLGQGHRSDLEMVAKDVKDGKSLTEVAEEHPVEWIKFNRGITSLANSRKPSGWRDVQVDVYWGETGSGKTKAAMAEYETGNTYKLGQNTNGSLWFDGYTNEDILIIDDFYGWIKYGDLLTLLDGYPYRCQVKGSHVWAKWTRVIITSNEHPEDWYRKEDKSALFRRINSIEKFTK